MSGPNGAGTVTLFHPRAAVGLEPMDPFGVFATDRRAQVTGRRPAGCGGPLRVTLLRPTSSWVVDALHPC